MPANPTPTGRAPEEDGPEAPVAAGWPDIPMWQVRYRLSRHLTGSGVELGPGHVPFPIVNPGVRVRLVDRWEADENANLFPELDGGHFPKPDIVAHLDLDRLDALETASQDFVIASHVLEHLSDPLGMLDDIHRVLRPGGLLLLLLPDRHRTFDRNRPPTPLGHVVDDMRRGRREVEREHVVEFIAHTEGLPSRPEELDAAVEQHRRRSVHAHVWDADGFFEVLLYATATLGHRWELVDAVLPPEDDLDVFDFGWVLRRSTVDADAELRARQLARSWEIWRSAHTRPPSAPPAPTGVAGVTTLARRAGRVVAGRLRAQRRARNGG